MGDDVTAEERMTVAASRLLRDGAVCFVGIGLPSKAANLARATHAPNLTLIYEAGAIGAKPTVLPLSIGDGELAITADAVVSTAEVFRYWLQGGHVDVGFLGAAQIDRHANINTTVIGPYAKPKVRLPGAGGAPGIASQAGEVFIVMTQSRRHLRREARLHHERGLPGWRRRSREARCPRPRPHGGHHRLRDLGAGRAHEGAHADAPSPGRHRRASDCGDRMGAARQPVIS